MTELRKNFSAIGILLALVGSTLIVYGDEKRGEATDEGQSGAPDKEHGQASDQERRPERGYQKDFVSPTLTGS